MEFNILPEHRKRANMEAIRQHNINRNTGRVDLLYSNRDTVDCSNMGLLVEMVLESNLGVSKCEGYAIDKRGSFDTDFRNHLGETIEVKSTDPTPERIRPVVLFNVDYYIRKNKDGKLGQWGLFVEFNNNWKVATKIKLVGFLPTEDFPNFPIDPDGTDITRAFHIPKFRLRIDFETILKVK
jgi:hypothetical protein